MRGAWGGLSRALASLVAGALASSCTQAPPPKPPAPVAAEWRSFLPEPARLGERWAAPRWNDLHARLLAGEDPEGIANRARAALAASGDEPGGQLILAEASLLAGNYAASLAALGGLPPELRSGAPVLLVEARAREGAGEIVRALELYRARPGAGEVPAARARAISLEPRAVELVVARIEDALARGRPADAQRDLERLRAWRPRDPATLALARAVAAAAGDAQEELVALGALAALDELSVEDQLRRAELEFEVGQPQAALGQLENLAARRPDDVAVADALERARFRWRFVHAPEPVQRAARLPELSRADLARMLYWMFPGVRGGRGGVARIASDVVGHAAQDEIVRVVNLGVMRVDETLHRFAPDRPAARFEALEAVFRAAILNQGEPACAREALAAGWSRDRLCTAATACGLVAEAAECLPGGALSGSEALEWIRLATAAGAATP